MKKLQIKYLKLFQFLGLITFVFVLLQTGNLIYGQTSRQLDREKSTLRGEDRVALVIGNGNYQNAPRLAKPVNDASGITQKLKDLGFEVLSGSNLNKQQMEKLIRDFGNKLASGSVGFFYYSGLAIQANGENYLIPIDAEVAEEDEASYTAVPLSLILTKMATAKNDLNLVLLEASYANPFAKKWKSFSESKNYDGLAKVSPSTGILVFSSAEPGKISLEIAGSSNSLFTESFVKQLNIPNQEYNQIAKNVSADIWQKTGKKQLPWKEGNSPLDFYFATNAGSESVVKKTASEVQPTNNEQNDWEEAERKNTAENYESYISKYPKGDYVALARVKINELKLVKETAITNEEKAKLLFRQGLKETNLDAQIEFFTKAIELAPQAFASYGQRGLAYYSKKEYDRAIADYSKAIEIEPLYADAYGARGMAYFGKNKYDLAIADFNKVIEIVPKSAPKVYQNRGQAYAGKKDYDRAISDYDKAIELNPPQVGFYYDRGMAYAGKKNFDKAIIDYTKAIEINPQIGAIYFERGKAYQEKNDNERAIADYNKAVNANPKLADAYFKRGQVYKDKKNYVQSIDDFTKVIEIEPQAFWAYVDRGIVFADKKDYERAISDYIKAIEINPQFKWAYLYRGDAYTSKKEYDKAISDYSKAIEIDPKFPFAYENRRIAYEKIGRKDLAAADKRKYEELKDK